MPKSKENPIVFAVPKGRVLTGLQKRLSSSGIAAKALLKGGRALIRSSDDKSVNFLLLKPDDVPTYVEYGAADVGVVGRDVLLERQYDLYAPVDLGIGKCRLMVCGKRGALDMQTTSGHPLRVATKFPTIATAYFRERGIAAEVIFVQGSVELAPLTGLADVIVDLVETGETLRQNGLAELELIREISSLLVVNRVSLKLKRTPIQRLIRALKA